MITPVTDQLDQYLMEDDVIDWSHPAIRENVGMLTNGITDDLAKAKLLYEWVRDSIPHSRDAGREEVTCTASQVLRVGTGICYAKAHLLAAMLRSVGIPVGFCYQVYKEPLHVNRDRLALHGLNAVFLASVGKWIRVDPRGNKPGVDAQFAVDREKMAFPKLPFLDNNVYPKPLQNVVAALRCYSTRSDLWPNLPSPPQG